ncbi:hypothetical protein [Chitinimonas lacunae]|uniref:PilZ domain-containing protein n=1 Tax=Chitinimonas lacunae TaxID=1963018 RepID=A0ABV8MPD7_9NEIS
MRKLIGSLNTLLRRELDPLSDPRSSTQWLKEQRSGDLSQQLRSVREIVSRVPEREVFDLAGLQALFSLDEAAQPSFELLCQQYIQNPRMGKQIEEKLWDDIMGFARAMLNAYHRYIKVENPAPDEEAGFTQATPVMLARALRLIGIQVKWHFFRFEAPPPQLWAGANQMYRLSEVSGVDCDPFEIYPNDEELTTSCADEFLRIQMLATLNNGNFTLRQFDWADRWLGLWSRHIQLERRYRDGVHQFCVNLAEPTGPSKIHAAVEGDLMRFWGVGELLAEMNRTMQALEAGDSPARLGLGDDARMPACLEFMRQLEILWARERNQQIHRKERTKVNRLVQVIHGLDSIFEVVRQDDERMMSRSGLSRAPDADELVDMKLYGYVTERTQRKLAMQQATKHQVYGNRPVAAEHDNWVIDNQSQGGLGVVLPLQGHDWVRLGVLLAMRNDDKSHWLIAVVRRLNRVNSEQLYAGIQILTTTAVSMSMRALEQERHLEMMPGSIDVVPVGMVLQRQGLYIPYQSENRRANTLLLHMADYQVGRLFEVVARDKVFLVRLSEVLEKGPDWIWAVVEVVKRG